MGSIGEHNQYLKQNSFENLDEFDEQVLNDNITLRKQAQQKQAILEENSIKVNRLIRNIERLSEANRLTTGQKQKLNEYIATANTVLETEELTRDDARKLAQLLRNL